MPDSPNSTAENPDPPLAEISPPVPAVRLSADLEMLRARLSDAPLSIGDIEASLKGRGFSLLLMVLALPFCLLPIPGLSTPFGVAVFLIGGRITLGQAPWLPEFVRRVALSADRLRGLLTACIGFTRAIEKLTRPRMQFMQSWPGMLNVIGFGIAVSGLLLLLPLPIPFSNTLPAFAVVMLTAGMSERDGLMVLLGYLVALSAWGYVAAISFIGKAGVMRLWHMMFD